jgi:hypothetical protein
MNLPLSLTEFEVTPGSGSSRRLRLREPTAAEVIGLALDEDIRTPDLVEQTLAHELYRLIAEIDGEEPTWEDVVTIMRDPVCLARVLYARNVFYNHLAELGRALAFCPFCDAPPAVLDLLFFYLMLKLPKWDFFDGGLLMRPPSLSSSLPAGRRPDTPPRARQLGYMYPSEPQVGRLIHALTTPEAAVRERNYWEQYTPEDSEPEEHPHWRRNSPGFRAILRLAVALNPDPGGREITPMDVDAMPLGAFLFLDLLYFATVNVGVYDAVRVQVKCSQCGQSFLPVL